MRARLAVLLALAVLAPAAPAYAATLSVDGGVLTYTAAPGEHNELDLWSDAEVPGLVYVNEYAADIEPGTDCFPVPDPLGVVFLSVFMTYHCTGVESVAVDLGDQDDWAWVDSLQPSVTQAGAGDDELLGSFGDDVIDAGPGDDTVEGMTGADQIAGGDGADRIDGEYLMIVIDGPAKEADEGGDDLLDGGAGDDLLRGGPGADTLTGGAGSDTADYGARDQAVTVSLDGVTGDGAEGEGDALLEVENVLTGAGNDTVTGDAGANTISSGAGADTLDGGAGADKLNAGAGEDAIAARDGHEDGVECGEGVPDRVTADAADFIAGDCEIADRPAGTQAAPPRVKPKGLTLRARLRGGVLRVAGRLRVPARTSCIGATVRVSGRAGGRPLRVDVPLDARCRLAVTVPVTARRVTLRATFAGTRTIAPARSRRVTVSR